MPVVPLDTAPLVTVARYRAITGDETTAASAVSARIEDATDLLEERLSRPLRLAQRVERMYPTRDGLLWPQATPIAVATGYTIEGYALVGESRWWSDYGLEYDDLGRPRVEVTYAGGYVERSENVGASNRLPACIERDLAFAALALGNTGGSQYPDGATSVRLGDASVTFGAPVSSTSASSPSWSRDVLAYSYRGAP